jgi:hypothetical protein
MPPKQEPVQDSSKAHLDRALQLAEESKQIGVNTIIKLDEQTEQMRRVQADAQDTEHIIKGNRGVVKDMRRNWMVRLCCYNRSDIVPDDVGWSHRETPEEQARVKKMIKLDKRRRQMRRVRKKEEAKQIANGENPASKTQEKKSSWKFWQKSKPQDSDDSDLSDISEDSEDEPSAPAKSRILPSFKAPQTASNKFSTGTDDIEYPDEDTALDQLHNTVQDLKVIALQISETSNQQTEMLGSISQQVIQNQDHLDRNNKLIGKLGRRAKEDGDDGILNAQDKLAIMGVKSALNAKFNQ